MNPDAEPLIVQRVKFKRAVSEPRRVDAAQSKDGARIEQLPLIVPRLRFSRTPDPIAAKNQAKEDERASFSSWVSSPGSDSVPRRKAPPSLTSTSTRSPPSSTTMHSDRVPRSTTPYKSSHGGEHDNSSRGYANPMTLTWSAKTPKPTKPSFTVKVELLKRGHQLIEVERFVVSKAFISNVHSTYWSRVWSRRSRKRG